MTTEIRPRERRLPEKISPVDRKISNLDGEYYKLTEVAKILGVSNSTMRRLLNRDDIMAPSFEMPMGDAAPVYLYTATDIAELRTHFAAAGPRPRK